MANLTITVDGDALKRANQRAQMQGTSVDAVMREFLEAYAGVWAAQDDALRELLSLSRAAKSRRGESRWTRDELYERSA